jgi:hypothetical protein
MPFEMLDVGSPLTDARIRAPERKLGIALPDGYRSFLLRYFPIRGSTEIPSARFTISMASIGR